MDTSVDNLIALLHQLQPDYEECNSVLVGDAVELTRESLEMLRPGQRLDNWLLGAAMELVDKPSCVRYGLCVPLDEHKDGKRVVITNPFGLWRRKIDEYRGMAGEHAKQIYFCPVNVDTNHFTLLEINEQQGMIYHYDSMAGRDVLRGRAKHTRMRVVIEVCLDAGVEHIYADFSAGRIQGLGLGI